MHLILLKKRKNMQNPNSSVKIINQIQIIQIKRKKTKQQQKMSFLCCPWCLNLFSSSKNQNSQKKAYKPSASQDMDEQQLIQHNMDKQQNQSLEQYFTQDEETKDLSKQLNVELRLPQNIPQNQEDHKSQTSSKEQSQLNNKFEQSDQEQNLLDQIPSEQKLALDYTKFSINLDPYDKYYKLLHQKTDNLQKYFTLEGKPIDFGQTKSNLRIFKIDASKFEIRFELPCSYSFYSMLMKDSNVSGKKYLAYFQKHQVLQAFKPNFTRNVTKIKRFNMLEPRQFVYLKYSNGSFKQNWEICINDSQDDLLSQQQSDHKRCDLFSVSNFKEINDKLYVRQYVQIDLKSNNMNGNIWGKIMHEVKQYFEKIYLHIQTYYQKQLL